MSVPSFSLREIENAVDTNGPLAQELLRCLETNGIFYLRDCGLDESAHAPARELAMKFFTTPSDEERSRLMTQERRLRRGYLPLGSESTAKSTSTGDYSDFHVSFSMGEHSNVFPNAEFQAVWSVYFLKVREVAHRLLDVTLKLVNHPSIPCDDLFRFRYYPDLPPERAAEVEPFRVAAHHDVSVYTLIHQTACPNGFVSLQCEYDGTFIEIPTVPNTMVIQVGAMLSIMTNGRLKSPKHRVAAAPLRQIDGSRRSASVFHIRPKPDFSFSIPVAHRLGHADGLSGEIGTFGEWVGGTYKLIHKL